MQTGSSESIRWMIHNEGRFKLAQKPEARHVTVVMFFCPPHTDLGHAFFLPRSIAHG